MRGRFHAHPLPPPRGVYCEGFADAATLAHGLGEHRRAAAYRGAVDRGLRSPRQLQFRDRRDAFYVSNPDRVMDALRTEFYDSAVRVFEHTVTMSIADAIRTATAPACSATADANTNARPTPKGVPANTIPKPRRRPTAAFVSCAAARCLERLLDRKPLCFEHPPKIEKLVHDDQQDHVPFVVQTNRAGSLSDELLLAWNAASVDLDAPIYRIVRIVFSSPRFSEFKPRSFGSNELAVLARDPERLPG